MYNPLTISSRKRVSKLALGLLHSRTNLSPFTKDFRGESQHNEHLGVFVVPCLRARQPTEWRLNRIISTNRSTGQYGFHYTYTLLNSKTATRLLLEVKWKGCKLYSQRQIFVKANQNVLIMLVPLMNTSYQLILSWGKNSERNNENAMTCSRSGWFCYK